MYLLNAPFKWINIHTLMVSGASESCPGQYCGRIVEDNGKIGDCGVSIDTFLINNKFIYTVTY